MEINLEARGCCGRSPVPLPDLTLCLPLFVKSEDEHSLDLPTILQLVKSNASSPQLLVLRFYNNGIGIGVADVMGFSSPSLLLHTPGIEGVKLRAICQSSL